MPLNTAPRLVVEDGKRKPQGMIYVPNNLAVFHKANVEALIIAVVRDGAALLENSVLEGLQEQFSGNLDIFSRPGSDDVFITLPCKAMCPEKLKKAIERIIEYPLMRITVDPDSLEEVSKKEIRSSLLAS